MRRRVPQDVAARGLVHRDHPAVTGGQGQVDERAVGQLDADSL
jgi:hypothetical protein